MNLWIRSQDKKRLLKCDNLKVEYQNATVQTYMYKSHLEPIGWVITNNDIEIGVYQTDIRALEVLDEIQSLLMPKLILNSYDNITPEFSENVTIMPILTDIKQFNSYVYEMPEE